MKQHGEEEMVFTDSRAFDRAGLRVPASCAPRRKTGVRGRVLLAWFVLILVILALSAAAWLALDAFAGSGARVPRSSSLTTFKSDKPYLDNAWFRKFAGLDDPAADPPSPAKVKAMLERVEQIRSVTVVKHLDSDGVDFIVRERTPCFRLLVKDGHGREEVRYMDSEGEENARPGNTWEAREEMSRRAIYKAEGYSRAVVDALPWLKDVKIDTPPGREKAGSKTAAKDADSRPPPLPTVKGGEQLARFALASKEILPKERRDWLHISARIFKGGFYAGVPGDSISVRLQPARQPFRVPAQIWVREVVFSANSTKFRKELERYARPEFRDWVGERLRYEATKGYGFATIYKICLGEEDRRANLRPDYGQGTLPPPPDPAAGSALAAATAPFIFPASARQP